MVPTYHALTMFVTMYKPFFSSNAFKFYAKVLHFWGWCYCREVKINPLKNDNMKLETDRNKKRTKQKTFETAGKFLMIPILNNIRIFEVKWSNIKIITLVGQFIFCLRGCSIVFLILCMKLGYHRHIKVSNIAYIFEGLSTAFWLYALTKN